MKVIKIGAEWCNGCLVMRPRWKEIESELPWLKTQYYDFDKDAGLVKKYNLDMERLPTFIFLDSKENEIIRLSGEIEKQKLVELIHINKDK